MSDKLNDLLNEYVDKFDESFPFYMADDDPEKIIIKCLKENKPYRPKMEKGAYY